MGKSKLNGDKKSRADLNPPRYKVSDYAHISMEYGDDTLRKYSTLNVVQEFINHGGSISPPTEVEFSKHFPNSPYPQTALTNQMPSNYLCMGSMSAMFYNGNQRIGGIAVSIYQDLTQHDRRMGDHYNAFKQWETQGRLDHTDHIPNRHIPLANKVILKGFVDQNEVIKVEF